ncbi:hypothetical protein MMC07_003216 [Pseudocyphellaria aurata]|nr:hypothetical protein [Pseudocyphellaria aurata]
MDPLSIAASAAGLLSLGITVCNGLLEYYSSWKDADEGVSRMYNSVEALTKTLILLNISIQHKSFNRDVVVRVEESITSTQGGLESLRKKLEKIKVVPQQEGWREKTKAHFGRAVFPFKESTLVKLKELGNELRDDLSIALDALQIDASKTSLDKLDHLSEQVTSVAEGVRNLEGYAKSIAADFGDVQDQLGKASANVSALVSAQDDEYLSKVYSWLSPLAGTFEKKQLETFNLKGRQDGTGKLLLSKKKFHEWLSGEGTTLWCPGIRKTVLTACIINHIQKSIPPNIGLAYIYFNYKEVEKQTFENLAANLVHQLLIQRSLLPTELRSLYEAHPLKRKRPSITDYLDLLQLAVHEYKKVLVVIDALDECNETGRRALIPELHKLRPRLNLLVTSRDLPNLQRQLQGAARLEIQASDEDIKNHIEERISTSDRLSMYIKKDPRLHELMIDTVTESAKGMFLQVRLHMDSISTKITLRKLKSALDSLPEGLDKTYDEVWYRIKAQNPDDAELATRVIYWVFHAFRPLTIAEMQHALAVEPGDNTLDDDNIPNEEVLVSVCAGIVLVQQESHTIGFVHNTTQEYFERRGVEHFPSARQEILRSCLTYLMFDEFNSEPCKTEEEMENRLDYRPFLKYAAMHWGDHARGQLEESEGNFILNFLSQNLKVSSSNQIRYLRSARSFNFYTLYYTHGLSALWFTSYFGLCRIARLQLESGVDVDARDVRGRTALHYASQMGRENVTRLLLEWKANIFLNTGYGKSALHYAARGGWGAVVETLLQHGELHKYKYGTEVYASALHIAATRKQNQVVRIFMDNLDRFEPADSQGRTLLHHACATDDPDLVNRLLSRGFDPRVLDKQMRTCIHHAASAFSAKVLRRLLEEGLDPNQTDIDHWTPLHWAARAGSEASVSILLGARGNQKSPSLSKWDPVTLALFHGHFRIAKLLRAKDNTSLQQPLEISSIEGDEEHRQSSPLVQLSTNVHRRDAVQALWHKNFECDGCDLAIYGPRYRCTVCDNFDFCFKCIRSAHETHPSHTFEMILFCQRRQSLVSLDGVDELEKDISREVKLMELTGYLAQTVFLDNSN